MKRVRQSAFILALTVVALAAESFDFHLSPGFPRPPVPGNNPMSAAKVALGRHLFYDTRLSVNGKQSCASCHRQGLAFTDGRARAVGTTGELHPRSSMSLVNIAYAPALTWADPKLDSLEQQALVPMLGTEPVELGLRGQEERVRQDLRRLLVCQNLFAAAFAGEGDPFRL